MCGGSQVVPAIIQAASVAMVYLFRLLASPHAPNERVRWINHTIERNLNVRPIVRARHPSALCASIADVPSVPFNQAIEVGCRPLAPIEGASMRIIHEACLQVTSVRKGAPHRWLPSFLCGPLYMHQVSTDQALEAING